MPSASPGISQCFPDLFCFQPNPGFNAQEAPAQSMCLEPKGAGLLSAVLSFFLFPFVSFRDLFLI